MHLIGQINHHRAAQALVDFLNAQGISAERQDAQEHSVILVRYPQHVEIAKQHFQDFLQNPNQGKYLAASWAYGDLAAGDLQNNRTESQRSGSAGSRGAWLTHLLLQAGWTTKAVAAMAILISIVTGFGSSSLLTWFTFDATSILNGEIYRIISPIFLHFPVFGIPILHLMFNLIWFWDFAGQIEKQLKSWWLAYLILVIGVVSNTCQWLVTQWIEPFPERHIFGGLSGVVYGLMGYLWARARWDGTFSATIQPAVFNFLIVWLAVGFTGILGNVANTAHLAGLLSGFGLAWTDIKVKSVLNHK